MIATGEQVKNVDLTSLSQGSVVTLTFDQDGVRKYATLTVPSQNAARDILPHFAEHKFAVLLKISTDQLHYMAAVNRRLELDSKWTVEILTGSRFPSELQPPRAIDVRQRIQPQEALDLSRQKWRSTIFVDTIGTHYQLDVSPDGKVLRSSRPGELDLVSTANPVAIGERIEWSDGQVSPPVIAYSFR